MHDDIDRHEHLRRGRMLAEISDAIVGLHSRYYGKGPTKAKTHLSGDILVCVLRDVFTTVERTLLEAGREDQVRHTRAVLQRSLYDEFCRAVESATGRKVAAFMSQIHFDPDVAVEVFLLEPEDQD